MLLLNQILPTSMAWPGHSQGMREAAGSRIPGHIFSQNAPRATSSLAPGATTEALLLFTRRCPTTNPSEHETTNNRVTRKGQVFAEDGPIKDLASCLLPRRRCVVGEQRLWYGYDHVSAGIPLPASQCLPFRLPWWRQCADLVGPHVEEAIPALIGHALAACNGGSFRFR
jgi:hypothetical protein